MKVGFSTLPTLQWLFGDVPYLLESQINWFIPPLSILCTRVKVLPLKSFFHVTERGWLETFLTLIHFNMFLVFPCL
jgi:hypothetical protein